MGSSMGGIHDAAGISDISMNVPSINQEQDRGVEVVDGGEGGDGGEMKKTKKKNKRKHDKERFEGKTNFAMSTTDYQALTGQWV